LTGFDFLTARNLRQAGFLWLAAKPGVIKALASDPSVHFKSKTPTAYLILGYGGLALAVISFFQSWIGLFFLGLIVGQASLLAGKRTLARLRHEEALNNEALYNRIRFAGGWTGKSHLDYEDLRATARNWPTPASPQPSPTGFPPNPLPAGPTLATLNPAGQSLNSDGEDEQISSPPLEAVLDQALAADGEDGQISALPPLKSKPDESPAPQARPGRIWPFPSGKKTEPPVALKELEFGRSPFPSELYDDPLSLHLEVEAPAGTLEGAGRSLEIVGLAFSGRRRELEAEPSAAAPWARSAGGPKASESGLMSISRRVDSATPELLAALWNEKVFPKIVLNIQDKTREGWVAGIKLTEVKINSYQLDHQHDQRLEKLEMEYQSLSFEYKRREFTPAEPEDDFQF